jgi:hypothetical protein
MNNLDEMPPKCHDCPYWERCKPPYVCPDILTWGNKSRHCGDTGGGVS